MRILVVSVMLLVIITTSCKKENNADPVPAIDSNFLRFTSSVPFAGTRNYVAATQGNTLSSREIPSQYLSLHAEVSEYDPTIRQIYSARLQFQNLRHTESVNDISMTIPWTDTSKITSTRNQKANLMLVYPNGDIWTSTGGTAHIATLGGGRIQGYFDATLTSVQQPEKTIQLTNGTFNVNYKF